MEAREIWWKNMNEDKLTPEAALRQKKIGGKAYLALSIAGVNDAMSPLDLLSRADALSKGLQELHSVLSTPSTYDPDAGVQLVELKSPDGLSYFTICVGGKIQYTQTRGKLDLACVRSRGKSRADMQDYLAKLLFSDPEVRRRISQEYRKRHVDNKEEQPPDLTGRKPQAKEIDANAGLEAEVNLSELGHNKGKDKELGISRKRLGEQLYFDPLAVEYIERHANVISYENFTDGQGKEPKIVSGTTERLAVIDDSELVRKLEAERYEVKVTSLHSFLRRNDAQIKHRIEKYAKELLDDPAFLDTVTKVRAEYALGRKRTLIDLCEDQDSGRELYNRFRTDTSATFVQKYLLCFRFLVTERLEDWQKHKKIGEIPSETMEVYRSNMQSWIGMAKAADYVHDNEWVQQQVLPLLQGDAPRNEVEVQLCENNRFTALLNIFQAIMNKRSDPGVIPEARFYRCVVNGLWVLGHMDSYQKDGRREPNTFKSHKVMYTDWVGHLFEKYDSYDAILRSSFEKRSPKARDKMKELDLNIDLDCERFGVLLYDTLPSQEQKQFSWVYDASRPLCEDGETLKRILRFYVGHNRDWMQKKLT